MSSLIPMVMAYKNGKISESAAENAVGGFMAIPLMAIMGFNLAREGLMSVVDGIKKVAKYTRNKFEFKNVAEKWKKNTEKDKIGTIERETNNNGSVIMINTEHGPVIRFAFSGKYVKGHNGVAAHNGSVVCYTGIREVEIDGKKQRVLYDGVGVSKSDKLITPEFESVFINNTDGMIFTESGDKISCFTCDRFSEGSPAPTNPVYDSVAEIEEWFEALGRSYDPNFSIEDNTAESDCLPN